MDRLYLSGILLFVVLCLQTVNCLECYVCKNQENNLEKCLNTIKTCEQGEDVCLTEVKWGSMPYWQQGAEKQYYVSKRCSTRSLCEKTRSRFMPYCTRIWYEDWKCSECCQGDRCNYFVILSGSTARSNIILLATGIAAVFAVRVLIYH